MKRIFGTKNLVFFTPIIILEDDSFRYKGKQYILQNIVTIERADDTVSNFFRNPSTIILLSDGVIIRLPITLEEKNVKQTHDFMEYGYSKSSAYKDLISIFENNISWNSSNYSKYLHSLNYIMFYRWLIMVSILAGLFILFALFYANLKMNPPLVLLMTSQFICLGIGLFMLIKRRSDESAAVRELNQRN